MTVSPPSRRTGTLRKQVGAVEVRSPARARTEPRRIVVASEAARLGRDRLDILEHHGFELTERFDLIASAGETELIVALSGAWGLIAGGQPIPSAVISASPELRVIARTGAGYNGIDVRSASACGIAVFVTPSQNADGVADMTVALMLSTARQIVLLDGMTRSGRWRGGLAAAPDLHRATVGLIGLGHIGKAVARRLSGFDCTLLASEPNPDIQFTTSAGIEVLALQEMLPRVDFLSLHVPLTDATYHLIGAEELSLLRPNAVVVNTSRGGTIDETALVSALKSGHLAGAGIDVFEHEPIPQAHPLTLLPNVVLTPHVAAYSDGAVSRVMTSVVDGILEVSAGRCPAGSLNGLPESAGSSSR